MMKNDKWTFYLIMNGEAPDDEERFKKSMLNAYVNGIEPLEYHKDALLDKNDNIVTNVTLVKCQQRWKGAAKRFFKKAKFTDTNQKVDGLHVYG